MCVSIYIYTHMFVCMFVCTLIHIYTYTCVLCKASNMVSSMILGREQYIF